MTAVRTSWPLLLLAVAACPPLEPDPVIKDGVDLGPIQSFEAERIPGQGPHVASIDDPSASEGHALGIFSQRTASQPLELLTEVSGFVVRAKGQECKGWPEMVVSIDGVPRLRTEVKNAGWRDFPGVAHLKPGRHVFAFEFTNDYLEGSGCDRNLFVDKMTFVNARTTNHGDLRAVSMLLPGGVAVVDDPRSSGGKAVGFMSSSEATGETELDRPMAALVVRARGEDCKGPPQINVTVDGIDRFSGMHRKLGLDRRADRGLARPRPAQRLDRLPERSLRGARLRPKSLRRRDALPGNHAVGCRDRDERRGCRPCGQRQWTLNRPKQQRPLQRRPRSARRPPKRRRQSPQPPSLPGL